MSEARQAKVGELRPSQIVFTFGVGSLIDLPNMSVVVMGLNDWDSARTVELSEERLLAAVRKYLGPQVKKLCSPPRVEPESEGFTVPNDGSSNVGVPVALFPRWLRCPKCDLLAPIESGLFSLKVDRYHPDRTSYAHIGCTKSQGAAPYALPVRFLLACENGHLDDFPWVEYVHRGRPCQRPILRLREFGVSGEPSDIAVKCETCENARTMADAFGPEASNKCRARRPHLRDFESKECPEPAKTILLGASNSWFPVTLSALSIPSSSNRLAQMIEDAWALLGQVPSMEALKWARDTGSIPGFVEFSVDDIWLAVEAKRNTPIEEPTESSADLRRPEWEILSNPDAAPSTDDFKLTRTAAPEGLASILSKVVLVERLREVRSLVGFTRIESPPDFSDVLDDTDISPAPLVRGPAQWVPTIEVRGEGIFIEFSESAVAKWCARPEILEWEGRFFEAHREWRRIRRVENEAAGFPGIRYVLLHSFAHAIMRQFAMECGYTAASVRERIYSSEPSSPAGPMAGVLLYTSAPDSEGTLGGLVSLGEPQTLRRHIYQALEQIGLCASDPLCAEHSPLSDGLTLHGAACHACLFAPETACERGNRYLDRSVLVPTFGSNRPAFFGDHLGSR